ncbi:fam-a protein [Plasmodium chabaudi chabaudi]|uniref:Fam-a protein n=1 Tax=Plasmodium chabaudi chabaudi TaxID=31271 RepID=A0A4V0K9G8_PLACU|nr:fam-a protein [Plasmodium chabaudi chabaudi]VTZ69482.1 fam-a protein [Plasmodium chabaudi chabaudi]|eukprot:XP_016654145.1 fam-a protein [Plasmodium chabaudi chabaudi]
MNKIYMKTVFSLLTLFTYASNKALGSEATSRETMLSNSLKNPVIYDPNIIYEKNKHRYLPNPGDESHAEEIMNEARTLFLQFVENTSDFKIHGTYDDNTSIYFMKYDDKYVGKIHTKIHCPYTYNEIVTTLWDPNGEKEYNDNFVSGNVGCAYNPNLLMIYQRYKNGVMGCHDYLYAFASKYKVSNNTTMIVKASANIIDHNRNKKKNENLLIKSANSFRFEIDHDEDVITGKLNNVFVDLSGYIITKNKEYVEIIHIDAFHDNYSSATKQNTLARRLNRLGAIADLKYYIYEKYTDWSKARPANI